MLMIFMIPLAGLGVAALINSFFQKAKFTGADVLPLFFLPACNLITKFQDRPSFLPYGFILFFLFVIVWTIYQAYKNKNISLTKVTYQMWKYLIICSVIWYLGLLILMLI